MKKLLPLLLLLAACTQPPEAPGTVAPVRDVVSYASFSMAPGDTLRYTINWTPGARATGYLVTAAVTQGAGWSGMLTDVPTTGTSMGFTPTQVAAWDSVSFRACVTSTKSGKANSSATCVDWTLIRGPTPPGSVDVDSSLVIAAIMIRPKTATLATNASAQFCPYAMALDGRVRFISGYEGVPACQQHYDTMANTLPGYPVAMASSPQWFDVFMGGTVKVASIRTPNVELAHLMFAGPFT